MTTEKNTRLLNVLKHPRRRVLLREMQKYPDGISPSELAVKVGESLSNAAYHCRVLRDSGAIALVDQQPVRGAIQSFYRFSIEDPWVLDLLRREQLRQDQDKDSDEAPDLDP